MATKGVNKVILLGNLGQDPQVKEFSGGTTTAISLATSESWKDKHTGETKTDTQWHRVVFFGKLAEIAGQYLSKGSKVYVEGTLKTRKYESKGEEKTITEIIGSSMQMLDSKPADGNKSKNQTADLYATASSGTKKNVPNDFDDDIPF